MVEGKEYEAKQCCLEKVDRRQMNVWIPKEFSLLVLDFDIACILLHLYYTSLDLIYSLSAFV